MLPNFGYGCQIMPTDVKKQGLPQMSANRPNIGSTGIIDWNFHDFFFVENNKKIIRNNFHWKIISIYENYIIVLLFFNDFITAMWEGKNFQKTQ